MRKHVVFGLFVLAAESYGQRLTSSFPGASAPSRAQDRPGQ